MKKKTGVFKKKVSPMRKKTTPPSQVHKKKKGKGSYDRKDSDTVEESADILKFIESLFQENYSDAYKYLNKVVESKLASRIKNCTTTPLF